MPSSFNDSISNRHNIAFLDWKKQVWTEVGQLAVNTFRLRVAAACCVERYTYSSSSSPEVAHI